MRPWIECNLFETDPQYRRYTEETGMVSIVAESSRAMQQLCNRDSHYFQSRRSVLIVFFILLVIMGLKN